MEKSEGSESPQVIVTLASVERAEKDEDLNRLISAIDANAKAVVTGLKPAPAKAKPGAHTRPTT